RRIVFAPVCHPTYRADFPVIDETKLGIDRLVEKGCWLSRSNERQLKPTSACCVRNAIKTKSRESLAHDRIGEVRGKAKALAQDGKAVLRAPLKKLGRLEGVVCHTERKCYSRFFVCWNVAPMWGEPQIDVRMKHR